MNSPANLLPGAYAMAPADPVDEEAFYAGVADLGVGGLEIPLPVRGAPGLEPSWMARQVTPSRFQPYVPRCLPAAEPRQRSGSRP